MVMMKQCNRLNLSVRPMSNKFILHIALLLTLSITAVCQSVSISTSSTNHTQVKDSTYTLTGRIKGVESGWVYLLHRQTEEQKVDSARVNNGEFVFTGKAPLPEFCNMGLLHQKSKDFLFGFFLENGQIILNGRSNALNDADVQIS